MQNQTNIKDIIEKQWEELNDAEFDQYIIEIANNGINSIIDGWSLLNYTLAKGRLEIAKILLNNPGIEVNIDSVTLMQVAAKEKDNKCKSAIIDVYFFLHEKNNIKKANMIDLAIYCAICLKDLKLFIKVLDSVDKDRNAINKKIYSKNLLIIASQYGSLDIIKFILESDIFTYTKSFENRDTFIEEAQVFYEEQLQLREALEAGETSKVIKIINDEKARCLWTYQDNKTIVDLSIVFGKMDVYFYITTCCDIKGVSLDKTEQAILAKISKNYLKPIEENNVVDSLCKKTQILIRPYNKPKEKYNDAVRTYYKNLYSQLYGLENNETSSLNLKYLKPILDVLMVSDVGIVYDPERLSIDILKPEYSANTFGECDTSTYKIHIGGKISDNSLDNNKILGTTIHEFTHLVCEIVWANKANPYATNDEDIEREFQDILKQIKTRFMNEERFDEIIERVFKVYINKREYQQASELIVRVPHIIAQYGNEGLKILKEQVPTLLEFYETKFLPYCINYLNPEYRFKRHCINKTKLYSVFNKEKIAVKNIAIGLSEINDLELSFVKEGKSTKFKLKNYKIPTVIYRENNLPSCLIINSKKHTVPDYLEEKFKKIIAEYKHLHTISLYGKEFNIDPELINFLNTLKTQINAILSTDNVLNIFKDRNKILILGKAGMGKSALCKGIVYKYASDDKLLKEYKWIFYIPLRNINEARYSHNRYDSTNEIDILHEIVCKECLPIEDFRLACFMYDEIKNDNILWLLDGYNELSEPRPDHIEMKLKILLERKHVVITSRHHESLIKLKVNTKLEITGFDIDKIKKYVESFFQHVEHKGNSLIDFLTKFDKKQITSSPINLEIICNIWNSQEGQEKLKADKNLTRTGLYKQISLWIMRCFLAEKGYKNEDLSNENRIFRRLATEIVYIEEIAFYLMQHKKLSLTDVEIKNINCEFKEDDGLYKDIKDLGFLALCSDPKSPSFEFIHQSFQEYFAACYIVKKLKLSSNGLEYQKIINFIKIEKYTEFNQLMFMFVACLLDYKSGVSKVFWECAHSSPLDITGIKHIHLLLSCLQETSYNSILSVNADVLEYISKKLPEILKFSNKISNNNTKKLLFDSVHESSAIISQEGILEPTMNALFSMPYSDYQPTVANMLIKNMQTKPQEIICDFLLKKIIEAERIDGVFKYAALSTKGIQKVENWVIENINTEDATNQFRAINISRIQKLDNDVIIDKLIEIATSVKDKKIETNQPRLQIHAIFALEEIGNYQGKVLHALKQIINDKDQIGYNLDLALNYSKKSSTEENYRKIWLSNDGSYVFLHSVTKKTCSGKLNLNTELGGIDIKFQNLEENIDDESFRDKIIQMLSRKHGNFDVKQVAKNSLDILYNKQANDYYDDDCECYDDDGGDDYPTLTPSESWLLRLDYVQFGFDDCWENFGDYNNSIGGAQISVSIKNCSSIIDRTKYNKFLSKKLDDKPLNIINIVMLDNDQIKFLLENNIYLLNTSLINLIKAYASFIKNLEDTLLGKLIAKRILYNGITITMLHTGIVIYEEGQINFLKANNDNKIIWNSLCKRFYKLFCEVAAEIEFPINNFEDIATEALCPHGAEEDELFVTDVEIEELQRLNNAELNLEDIINLGIKKIEYLLVNEQYLLKTSLDILIKAYANFENKPENEKMGELIAKRIFYCGAILIQLHNGFSIDDGNKIITMTYKSYWANFTEKFLSLLCKLSTNNEFPKIRNEKGGNTYNRIHAIYYYFIMNNFLPADAQDLRWMKKIYDEQKQKEEGVFRVETTIPKIGTSLIQSSSDSSEAIHTTTCAQIGTSMLSQYRQWQDNYDDPSYLSDENSDNSSEDSLSTNTSIDSNFFNDFGDDFDLK
jgi:hypothetical protein